MPAAKYLQNVPQDPRVSAGLLDAVARTESSGNPNAVSPKGALGLMQVMPATARDLGIDPMDPIQARQGAQNYLNYLIKQTGNLPDALAAYNLGLGKLKKLGTNNLPQETKNYVKKVLSLLGEPTPPSVAAAPVNASDPSPKADTQPIVADSGPSAGGGVLPAMMPYRQIQAPISQFMGKNNPLTMVNALLKDPMSLSWGEGMAEGGFVKLPSRKHVPNKRYGFKRIQSSVPGPSVGGDSGEGEGMAGGGAVIRSAPRNKFLGTLSDLANYIDVNALEPVQRLAERAPIGFSGTSEEYLRGKEAGLLGMLVPRLNSLGNVLNEASYEMPLTTGRGMTTGVKPEVGYAVLEASQLPGLGKGALSAVKGAGKIAKEQLPSMASRAMGNPLINLSSPIATAVKPQGGQWMPGVTKQFVKDVSGSAIENPQVAEFANRAIPRYVEKYMGSEGDPLAGIQIPAGRGTKSWEELTDPIVRSIPAQQLISRYPSMVQDWMRNLPGETPLYDLHAVGDGPVQDYISHTLDYAATLPPEKLKNYDFPRLVKEVQKIDAERAAKMNSVEGRLEGTVPHKQYPSGYQWVEVQSPEALKNEGDIMGHCVGGYCKAVEKGQTKIYSLRDPSGQSHVTIEVRPPDPGALGRELDARNLYMKASNRMAGGKHPTLEQLLEFSKENAPDLFEKYSAPIPSSIDQIKGKQNLAPKPEYQPYVQDFIRSGNWGDVRDLGNASMVKTPKELVEKYGPYMTQEEQLDYAKSTTKENKEFLKNLPESTMKKGGSVKKCKIGGDCGCLKCLRKRLK